MTKSHLVPVPRRGDPPPSIVHQSTTYSDRVNTWLREDQRDMPWHIIDSIAIPSTDKPQSTPNTSTRPSSNPATQGSARQQVTLTSLMPIPSSSYFKASVYDSRHEAMT
ncbi:hypothetical protein FBEOM_12968 [Fusarium beomiforme]|uniref:Uncharacterized protein n=1 Tax=Fusarium beomiforme TaxID=44412 RepID=A0A9P5A7W2_9HYPO|nr:hypothetical protein FBEOM_12968 [Fusarium beomiforme]